MSRARKINPSKRLRVVPTAADVARFMGKVVETSAAGDARLGPCWMWRAHTDAKGYGQIHIGGRVEWAHRVAYAMFRGTIPAGLQIDHKCNNPSCVNPHHLKRATPGSNYARANRRRHRVKIGVGCGDDVAPF